MQIQRYAHTNVFQLSMVSRESAANRKLAMPVDASTLLYSRFKHVHGTPSTGAASGLSLSRLRAIDNLIDRLISLRGKNTYWVNVDGMKTDELAFTMEKFQKELNHLVSSSEIPVTAGSPQNDLGLIFNAVA